MDSTYNIIYRHILFSLLITMELAVQNLTSDLLERSYSNRLSVLLNDGFRFNLLIILCKLSGWLYCCQSSTF